MKEGEFYSIKVANDNDKLPEGAQELPEIARNWNKDHSDKLVAYVEREPGDRYQLIEGEGFIQGGVGKVIKVYDRKIGRDVAAKITFLEDKHAKYDLLRERYGSDRGMSDVAVAFMEEARVLAELEHPNIMKVYDFGLVDDDDGIKGVIILEYIDGKTLFEIMKEIGGLDKLTKKDKVNYFTCMAEVIDYLHKRGIVHRDIKLSALMIEKGTNRPVFGDLGGAVSDDGLGVKSSVQWYTPGYLYPHKESDFPVEVDRWNYGVVLFESIFGTLPFEGSDFDSIEEGGEAEGDLRTTFIAKVARMCEARGVDIDFAKFFRNVFFADDVNGELKIKKSEYTCLEMFKEYKGLLDSSGGE